MPHPANWTPVPWTGPTTLGDHRRFPGARVLVQCGLCGWSKGYNPQRIITRLQQLRAGGYPTPLDQVARRVAWTCPGCGRVKWRAQLAWPPGMTETEIKRLMRIVRD